MSGTQYDKLAETKDNYGFLVTIMSGMVGDCQGLKPDRRSDGLV